jgi:hypothetical protein
MKNHLPLDALFKDPSDLSQGERQNLSEHLNDCDICRTADESLHALENRLRSEIMVSPDTGFAARWAVRLEVERETTHRKQIILMIVGLGLALSFIGGLLLVRIWPLILSPHLLIMTWVYRLLELYAYLVTITAFTRSLADFTPNFLPFLVWISSISMLISLMVLMYMSYRLLKVNKGQ